MPSGYADLQQRLQWTTRGANCTICNALRGRVYSYDQWMSANVWPGFHVHCDCYLKMVGYEIPLSDPDFFGMDLDLTLNGWFGNLPEFGAYLQLNFNFKPFPVYSINEIEKAHLKYGAHLSIGEVLKRMRNDFEGFFKRSPFWDYFFQWRVLRTIRHYQNIDGIYSGDTPPGFGGLWRDHGAKEEMQNSPYFYGQVYSNLNNQLKADELIPLTPAQSFHWGG